MITPLLRRTIAKMLASQQKKKEILEYIKVHYPSYLANPMKEIRVKECCNVLRFINYGEGKQRLYRANFCKYDIFCVACATRRSIKMIQKFVKGIYGNGLEQKEWYHITLTIRHKKTDSLESLLEKIMQYKVILTQRVRNGKRKSQSKQSFFGQFLGLATSIEITYSKKNGRHPHTCLFG